MDRFPLPSHVHYELLLQLLERQTAVAARQSPALEKQVQAIIISLRKAMAQQKQLEATCEQMHIHYEHHWSLNEATALTYSKDVPKNGAASLSAHQNGVSEP